MLGRLLKGTRQQIQIAVEDPRDAVGVGGPFPEQLRSPS